MLKLSEKVAFITGAGSGQGRASAILFAQEGARVVVADLNLEGAEEVAKTIQAAGGEAVALRVDVSQEDQVKAAIDRTVEMYGRLDVLFNNAGVGYSSPYIMASVVQTPVFDWDIILGINLRGTFLGCKHALPVMAKQGKGSIINNSSVSGLVATPGADAYTAAKGGVIALTRVLANDWGGQGIRVNCICPGPIDTPMVASRLADPAIRKASTDSVPLGRIGKPEEIASAALFLASDESSYITGVILPVDGGWTCR